MILAMTHFFTTSARAEESELRLTARGDLSAGVIKAFDGEGTNILYGGGMAAAYGLFDWLEAGINLSALPYMTSTIDGAVLSEQGGDERFELFTTLSVIDATASLRAYLEIGPFLRLRPFVGAGAGVQFIHFSDPELFLEGALISEGESELSASFIARGEIGLAYRLSDRFESAIVANTSVSNAMTTYGIGLEFSWMR